MYADSDQPIADQWMYHAVADTVLANSLLRSLPEVDADRVGVMGISWGGIITSTVMGIDNRFAFAIPTYGCGSLSDAGNQYGRALGDNPIYQQVWDPMVRMDKASMPSLW
ncbi:prolyl oligopeptidase family serine peptidase [Rubripirellula lacrimiformis]|uniref:prolyl oligopeptidase family serine peptidase n=1 Tax=Rubripirellula lacrimiformis TaxID=1930273 RepID=UPI0028F3F9BC|nr:prolyl oligopeptidase family serine peptidase [Rubripirellula lacrimiformis]